MLRSLVLTIFLLTSLARIVHAQREGPPIHYPVDHFVDPTQVFIVPYATGGLNFPSESNSRAGFMGSAGAILGLHIHGFLYHYLGTFVGASGELRMWSDNTDHDLLAGYATVTPGLSYRGIVNLGLAIGLPVAGVVTSYNGSDAGFAQQVRPAAMSILLEPRLFFGYPLHYSRQSGNALIILAQAGYPLTDVYKRIVLDLQNASLPVGHLRLPHVQLGLSAFFQLRSRELRPWDDHPFDE